MTSVPPDYRTNPAWVGEDAYRRGWPAPNRTPKEIPMNRPDLYTHGLGELIRAHRLYIGLSQREMATRLGKDRRDYQRIESGRDACPPGLMAKIEALSDQFAHDVDILLEEAEKRGGLALSYEVDTRLPESERDEWHRLVAGRAAVEALPEAPITLTVVTPSKKPA